MKRAMPMEVTGGAGAPRPNYDQAFATWVQQSKDMFARFGGNFDIQYANPAFCRNFGIAMDAIADAGLSQFGVLREISTQWCDLLERAYNDGKERSEELWLPTQNGLRCFRMHVAPERLTGNGPVESIWANGRDITDIRGAQSILGETEARFKAIVSNVPGAVFQLAMHKFDDLPRFQYVSDGIVALCGLAPEMVQRSSDNFTGLIHPDDIAVFHQSMKSSSETLTRWSWAGRLCAGTHAQRWISLQATPRLMDAGMVLWDGIMLDATDARRNEEKLRQSEEFLRDLCVRVGMIREEEKSAIAREIHDELGQLLTVLKMDLSCMREAGGIDSRSVAKMLRMESLTDDILHRVRDIASTLRPKVLDLGLAPAIEWLAQEFSSHTRIVCRLSINSDELCGNLDSTAITAIFRIVQESLTNVARHARAKHIDISMTRRGQFLQLLIRDDGVGFDPDALPTCCNGLSGIRERAVILGAELRIDSSAQTGTTLEVLIPHVVTSA